MLKRLVNLTVSVLVGTTDWLSDRVNRLVGGQPRRTGIVLTYHSVTAEERAAFGRQMDLLLRSAHPVAADIEALPSTGGNYAALTFDDGLQCIVDNVLPELESRRLPCTLFIVTEVLGGHPGWQVFGPEDPSTADVMSGEQLQKLPPDLVAIGSHTMTHPVLPTVDEQHLREELLGSRMKLEKLLNRKVRLLSFPYGAFNDEVIEMCRNTGYERFFSALPIRGFRESHEFLTGRVGVSARDWPVEFRLKLAGAYRWLPYAFAWKRRIRQVLGGRVTPKMELRTGEKLA